MNVAHAVPGVKPSTKRRRTATVIGGTGEPEAAKSPKLRFRTTYEYFGFHHGATMEARMLLFALQSESVDKVEPERLIGNARLAKILGVTIRSIQRSFQELDRLEWITREFDPRTKYRIKWRFLKKTAHNSEVDPSWGDDQAEVSKIGSKIYRAVYDRYLFDRTLSVGSRFLILALLSQGQDEVDFRVQLPWLAEKLATPIKGVGKEPAERTIRRWLAELKAAKIGTFERDPDHRNKCHFTFTAKVGPHVKLGFETIKDPVTPMTGPRVADDRTPVTPMSAHSDNVFQDNTSKTSLENAVVENPPVAIAEPSQSPDREGSSNDSRTKVDFSGRGEGELPRRGQEVPEPSTLATSSSLALAPMPDSDDAGELVGWLNGFRPDLVELFAAWCQLLPVVWIKALILQRVVGQPGTKAGLLVMILTNWKLAGRCEYISSSSLANPSGRSLEPDALTSEEMIEKSKRGTMTDSERRVVIARNEASRRLSGKSVFQPDPLRGYEYRRERLYLMYLWDRLSDDERSKFDPGGVSLKTVRFKSNEPPTSLAEVEFATLHWNDLDIQEQERFKAEWIAGNVEQEPSAARGKRAGLVARLRARYPELLSKIEDSAPIESGVISPEDQARRAEQGLVTVAENWAIKCRCAAERILPDYKLGSKPQNQCFFLPDQRMYLVHLWNQLDCYEQRRLEKQAQGRAGQDPTKPLGSQAELNFATLHWNILTDEEQDKFKAEWATNPPEQYKTAKQLADEELAAKRRELEPFPMDDEDDLVQIESSVQPAKATALPYHPDPLVRDALPDCLARLVANSGGSMAEHLLHGAAIREAERWVEWNRKATGSDPDGERRRLAATQRRRSIVEDDLIDPASKTLATTPRPVGT